MKNEKKNSVNYLIWYVFEKIKGYKITTAWKLRLKTENGRMYQSRNSLRIKCSHGN